MKTIRTGTLALAVMAATSGQSTAEGDQSDLPKKDALAPETSRQPQERPRSKPVTQPFAQGSAQPNAPREYERAQIAEASPERKSTDAGDTTALTPAEIAAFRQGIQACWTTAGLSQEASAITVTVGFALDRDAMLDRSSIGLVSASEGSDAAVSMAFKAASRAIIRCGANGFDLPKDKYDQWREIELVFSPERMRNQ